MVEITRKEIAQRSAMMLLDIGAIKLSTTQAYRLASGLNSPVYVDCRKIISYPRLRATLMDFAVSLLYKEVGKGYFDAVAGGETAGIAFAAWIADKMNLPMQYVRKQPKGYGINAQIEGDIVAGSEVLLVEDLATDCGTKIKFAQAIRHTGARCRHSVVIFYYDIFVHTPAMLAANDLKLHSLLTWRDVLSVACAHGQFDAAGVERLQAFLQAPRAWSQAYGGNYHGS